MHVLPSGAERSPSLSLSYRGARLVADRIEMAHGATERYLSQAGVR